MERYGISPNTAESKELIACIFAAKKVPLSFIKDIRNHRYIHSDDWENVKDTVSAKEDLKEFDFYFNYVLEKFDLLKFP